MHDRLDIKCFSKRKKKPMPNGLKSILIFTDYIDIFYKHIIQQGRLNGAARLAFGGHSMTTWTWLYPFLITYLVPTYTGTFLILKDEDGQK